MYTWGVSEPHTGELNGGISVIYIYIVCTCSSMWNCTMIKHMRRWLKPGPFCSLGLGMRLIHWVKGTMFNFFHMLFLSHGLDPLMSSVHGARRQMKHGG